MTQENLYTKDCIRARSGIYMNVFEPTSEMICIEDIAHGLSNTCRWGGQCRQFYSVAQHSVLCAATIGKEFKLAMLLHDASEAYLSDIPSPIKKRMPEYTRIEDNLMTLIAKKFGFQYPLQEEVKATDKSALELEWRDLMLDQKDDFEFQMTCWSPEEAKDKFMEVFKWITDKK